MDGPAMEWSQVLADADDAAWLVGAFIRLVNSGVLDSAVVDAVSAEDRAAADVLASSGLLIGVDDGLELPRSMAAELGGGLDTRALGLVSSLRQLVTAVGILADAEGQGWATYDDDTLIAQGQASALGGTMLAMAVVPSLDGLDARFDHDGRFLDVGVGIAALTAAFCAARPAATVVGIDVLPRALELAHQTIEAAGCADRVELRRQGVQDLTDTDQFDLAWLPAPFIPEELIEIGVQRLHRALRAGGWLAVGAGRFEGTPLSIAVTRWKTLRGGGTPLSRDDASKLLEAAGFTGFQQLATPPGAPALYAAQKP